jgi:hypothetical protein
MAWRLAGDRQFAIGYWLSAIRQRSSGELARYQLSRTPLLIRN